MQRLSGFQNGLIAVYARILAAANSRRSHGAMSGGITMLGSCPVVSHQASTADARAQKLPTKEFRVTVATFEAEGAASDAATAELREGRRHAEEVLQPATETRREAW